MKIKETTKFDYLLWRKIKEAVVSYKHQEQDDSDSEMSLVLNEDGDYV